MKFLEEVPRPLEYKTQNHSALRRRRKQTKKGRQWKIKKEGQRLRKWVQSCLAPSCGENIPDRFVLCCSESKHLPEGACVCALSPCRTGSRGCVYNVFLCSINTSAWGIVAYFCVCTSTVSVWVRLPFPCLACFLQAGTHGPHRRLAALHDSLAPSFRRLLCSFSVPPFLPYFSSSASNCAFKTSLIFYNNPLRRRAPIQRFPPASVAVAVGLPPEIILVRLLKKTNMATVKRLKWGGRGQCLWDDWHERTHSYTQTHKVSKCGWDASFCQDAE